MRIPVLGSIAAGKPVEFLPITQWRQIRPLRDSPLNVQIAAVQIIGDSLAADGIIEGDYVIFKLTHEARSGDLVVALTPDGLTVKYLHILGETIILRSATRGYPDQMWDVEQVTIQGVVKRIERDM